MLGLLRKTMTGGLYFGPAGWTPEGWGQASVEAGKVRLLVGLPEGFLPGLGWPEKRMIRRGQCLVSGGEAGVDVLAPVTGQLGAIREIQSQTSVRPAIELTPPAGAVPQGVLPGAMGEEAEDAASAPPTDVAGLMEYLRRAGIGQLSPQVPSLLSQLQDLGRRRARAIVVNMMPTQPESRLPYALAAFDMPYMLAGLHLLRKVVPARRVVVAADRHEWLSGTRRWRKAIRKAGIRVQCLLNRYPQANPTMLVRTLLRRRLAVDASPASIGVIMLDPVTLWALGRRLVTGEGLTSRPVELFATDASPAVAMAPLGMPLRDLLRVHGLRESGGEEVQWIVNGMLAGWEANPDACVVTPIVASVAVRELPLAETPSACIQCGWCVDHCPTELNPLLLYQGALSGGARAAGAKEALHCVACGLCSYVCPTRLPLTQEVVGLRAAIRREREGGEGERGNGGGESGEQGGGR